MFIPGKLNKNSHSKQLNNCCLYKRRQQILQRNSSAIDRDCDFSIQRSDYASTRGTRRSNPYRHLESTL